MAGSNTSQDTNSGGMRKGTHQLDKQIYGLPQSIISDRGTNFISNLWKNMSKQLGIDLHHTTSYNPEANGVIERFHRTLKTSIAARCNGQDWIKHLPWIMLSLRSSPHQALNASPAEALYGKTLRIAMDLITNLSQEEGESLEEANSQQWVGGGVIAYASYISHLCIAMQALPDNTSNAQLNAAHY